MQNKEPAIDQSKCRICDRYGFKHSIPDLEYTLACRTMNDE